MGLLRLLTEKRSAEVLPLPSMEVPDVALACEWGAEGASTEAVGGAIEVNAGGAWEKLSVGVTQFDNEHKVLVGMVNDLFVGVQAGRGKDLLGPILDGMINYTKAHFANEEHLLSRHKYAQYEAHKAEHDALARQLLDVQAKYRGGASAALGMEVMNLLQDCLVTHITGTDRAYTLFLNSKGVK